jgi:ribosomal protein L37AE/L43A
MSKIEYDEFDDEMNPFHPCLACGCKEFSMNWDTGLYECDSCGLALEVGDKKEKSKPTLKKFRGLKKDDEIY